MLTLMERYKMEMEDTFVNLAEKAIQERRDFEDAVKGHPEYNESKEWRCRFADMSMEATHARLNRKQWNADGVRQSIKQRRQEEQQKAASEAFYQSNCHVLKEAAKQGYTWPKLRREGYPDMMEPLFRRAQAECGLDPEAEEKDEHGTAFLAGFSSRDLS